MSKLRDYAEEYRSFHGTPAQIANRAKRNSARASAVKAGTAKKGDGKEVDHKVPLSKGGSNSNSKSNTRVVSRATNRKKGAST